MQGRRAPSKGEVDGSIAPMPANRVFFPQGALARWLDEGKVELAGENLTMRDEGHTYRIVEAARIVREITGTPDPHGLQGRVKGRAFLDDLGAEIIGDSMIIGDNAYDIVSGFLGTLVHDAQNAQPSAQAPAPPKGADKPASDEELLVKFLLKGL